MLPKYIFIHSKQICIEKEIFLLFSFFSNQLKYLLLYEFFIWCFSSDHTCSSIFIFKSQNFSFSIQIEQEHDVVRKLLRKIQNIKILFNES